MIALLRNPIVTGLAGAGLVALVMGWQLIRAKGETATAALRLSEAQAQLTAFNEASAQAQDEAISRLTAAHQAEMIRIANERTAAEALTAAVAERERKALNTSRRLRREINELAARDADAAVWLAGVPPSAIRMRGSSHGSCTDCDRGAGSDTDSDDTASDNPVDWGAGFTAGLDQRGFTYRLRAGTGRAGRVQYAAARDSGL